jgi:hypothetical protein
MVYDFVQKGGDVHGEETKGRQKGGHEEGREKDRKETQENSSVLMRGPAARADPTT